MPSVKTIDRMMLAYLRQIANGSIPPITIDTLMAWSQFHFYELDN